MGCTSSVHAIGKKKRKSISEVSIFVPPLHVPLQSDIQTTLIGLVPKDLADRISSLRNQIVLIAHGTEGSGISELQKALEEYLPILLGLTKKEHGLQESIEFKWKQSDDGRQETCIANVWLELLSVFHMMSVLTLRDANSKLIPKQSSLPERLVSADGMRDAIGLLLKAAGYLNFCVEDVLIRLPPEIKKKMPTDLQESVLEAVIHQILGQGTELQLGLAIQSKSATLAVKRRLACELMSYFAQAHCCLCEVKVINAAGKKQSLFLKWKYLEAKVAAYYYHGLIFDKGAEPSSHRSALCCFLAANELLTESKKACLTYCLADPVTRAPPPWGAMRHLHKRIPEIASKKSQMYGYLLGQEKGKILPGLPQFQLSLEPDEYELPELDPAWGSGKLEITRQKLGQILSTMVNREPDLEHNS